MNALRLKEYRKKLKLSQREVSSMLDITQAYYWKWETGKSFPNSNQILQICEIFKCTPNDLFGIYGDFKVTMDDIDQD